MTKSSGKINVNGVSIFYQMMGTGEDLILISGLGMETWAWEKHVPFFAKNFRTIVFDNRGVGQSDKPTGPYSISLFADDLLALMDSLKITKAHILGISMGGFIALEFAINHPERINKLVLLSTSGGGADHVPMSQEVLAAIFAPTGENPREIIRSKLALAFSPQFMQTPEIEHLIDLRLKTPQPRAAFMAQAGAGATFDRATEVSRITNPTLIMAATGDLIVPAENSRILAQKIKNSQLKLYQGFGHQFLIEIAEQFVADVTAFLAPQIVRQH